MSTIDPVLIWAWLGAVVDLAAAGVLVYGVRQIRRLADVPTGLRHEWPMVSVVVAARNEERDLPRALESLLRLDYPALEIIVVNDRSTDRTGELLEQYAAADPRLRVIHIEKLPAEWLGKNHALHQGAAVARGELLLFTDADVVFSPTVLRRAVTYMQANDVDLLAAIPQVRMPTLLLQSFAITFMMMFFLYFQPWRARLPRSKAYIGIGAFNLVKAEAYRQVGGHAPIAMRPDDDVKLGQLLKLRGKKIDVVEATGELVVPWYASLAEVVRGLEKNTFAGVEYRIDITMVFSAAALIFNVLPFIMVFIAQDIARAGFALSCVILLALSASTAVAGGMNPLAALGYPIATLLFVIILWRNMVLTLWQGGIRWRDTFYSLKQLRENRVT